MANFYNTVKKWAAIVETCLGRTLRRYSEDLILNIKLVDLGIKDSYLLDIGVSSASLLALLKELKKQAIIDHNLNILLIGMDHVIVEPNLVLERCDKKCENVIVDVSKDIKAPAVSKEKLGEIERIKSVIRSVPFNYEEPVCCETDTGGCNITTLFGFLLNYPTLYWYETTGECTDTCLNMEPLICYKVKGTKRLSSIAANSHKDIVHVIWSFSVPVCTLEHVQHVISKWSIAILKKAKECLIFDDVFLGDEKIQLETVCL